MSGIDAAIFQKIHATTGAPEYTGGTDYELNGEESMENGHVRAKTAYRVVANGIRTLTLLAADINENDQYSQLEKPYECSDLFKRTSHQIVGYATEAFNAKPGFLSSLVPVVIENLDDSKLRDKSAAIIEAINDAEMNSLKVLRHGRIYLERAINHLAQPTKVLPPELAWHLEKLFQFPADLTQLMCHKWQLALDMDEFEELRRMKKEEEQVHSTTCTFCGNPLFHFCKECQRANGHDVATSADEMEECGISMGACSHQFHTHCMARWLRIRPDCPIDKLDWELHKRE